jgi:O-antigen/teichoic acid export membrane protein
MISGFVALGGCSVAFGSALHEALGGTGRAGPVPRLVQVAGVLTIAVGLLRRDQMLLTGSAGESWHNRAHDVLSISVYLALIVIPVLLQRRLRGDQRFREFRVPLVASAATSAAVLALFASPALPSWDAVLQRVAVTLPLAATAAIALRLATLRSASMNGEPPR